MSVSTLSVRECRRERLSRWLIVDYWRQSEKTLVTIEWKENLLAIIKRMKSGNPGRKILRTRGFKWKAMSEVARSILGHWDQYRFMMAGDVCDGSRGEGSSFVILVERNAMYIEEVLADGRYWLLLDKLRRLKEKEQGEHYIDLSNGTSWRWETCESDSSDGNGVKIMSSFHSILPTSISREGRSLSRHVPFN